MLGNCGHFALADLVSRLFSSEPLDESQAKQIAAMLTSGCLGCDDDLCRSPVLLGGVAEAMLLQSLAAVFTQHGVAESDATARGQAIMARLGHEGIQQQPCSRVGGMYFEPRGPEVRQPCRQHTVVWLPRSGCRAQSNMLKAFQALSLIMARSSSNPNATDPVPVPIGDPLEHQDPWRQYLDARQAEAPLLLPATPKPQLFCRLPTCHPS